jgi:hypothetical protein
LAAFRVGRRADFLADFFADRLVDRFADFLAERLADFFADFLADFFADFLADLLADFFVDFRALFLAAFRAVFLVLFLAGRLLDFLAVLRRAPPVDRAMGRAGAAPSSEVEAAGVVAGDGAGADSEGRGSIHPEPDQPISIE